MSARKLISDAWLTLTEMYGKPISKQALTIMVDAVEDLPEDAVLSALRQWPKKSKQLRHPLPAEIREMITPTVDDVSLARDSASRIEMAIKKFGYTNPEKAFVYIGEIGWSIVERRGGWLKICETTMDDELGMFNAQNRDLAIAQLHLHKAGLLSSPPSFPKLENTKKETTLELEPIGSIYNKLKLGEK